MMTSCHVFTAQNTGYAIRYQNIYSDTSLSFKASKPFISNLKLSNKSVPAFRFYTNQPSVLLITHDPRSLDVWPHSLRILVDLDFTKRHISVTSAKKKKKQKVDSTFDCVCCAARWCSSSERSRSCVEVQRWVEGEMGRVAGWSCTPFACWKSLP